MALVAEATEPHLPTAGEQHGECAANRCGVVGESPRQALGKIRGVAHCGRSRAVGHGALSRFH